ncbi:MAG: pyridoxal phosphate-dependent aminotransferase [Lachnospiraceae bacterium]|nr:pyridoxal phosphate-dependent aminotransferase [Lachnospiraceae bacterium]
MLAKKYAAVAGQSSVIREIFEYGKQRAKVVGPENVFDFSIGNPSVPAPEQVNETAIRLLNEEDPCKVHGYPSAVGYDDTREAIAENLNRRYGMHYHKNNIFMTIGAASAISLCFRVLADANVEDEIMVCAPYFPEYKCFIEGAGVKVTEIAADIADFQIDFEELESKLNEHTRAIIINSPNNPTGVVYSEETLKRLASILEEASNRYKRPIYIISDEPYREIVFGGKTVPYVPHFYKNTLVCYSYSKSLSLPGERVGYIAFTDEIADADNMLGTIGAVAREMGYVGVPSLFQMVVRDCVNELSDISVYETNKNIIYKALTEMGYQCVEPGGTFYIFPRCLEEDAQSFCNRAQKYDLLLVPSDSFSCKGHFRMSYCVPTERVERALPLFEKLIQEYRK